MFPFRNPLAPFNTDELRHRALKGFCYPANVVLMIILVRCSNYVCPATLACVHFPHHCPCAFPDIEDKFELGEGIAICASKGGSRQDEALQKVELARKGLL